MSDEFAKLLQEGRDQLTKGQLSESRDIFRKVVRRSSEIGDRPSLADAFSGLAEAESDLGNLPTAEHIYSNAAVVYRELGNRSNLTRVLQRQTALLRTLGRTIEADITEQEARSPDREPGNANQTK